MARNDYRIADQQQPHFLTSTVVGWLPVFTRPEAAQILFNSWRFLQTHAGLKLFAYVVLENHIHWIASAPNLSHELARFKSFTARQLIDLLESSGAETLLEQLRYFKLRHKSEQDYQLWQEGSKSKVIESDEVMWQKVEYIHNNPVKRGYVDEPAHWRWSSARSYAKQGGLVDVCTDW